ncbi:SDR family oxidoreductase [Actinomadura scrupuli]|uniref:SDR family oxidoreductase n=1 Tax=Actinomadura scrupuli TaxID=559629 RepID=UPI003D99147A
MTTNTIALITGANKGIGFEIARQLGGTVLIGARSPERGATAVATLRAEGADAHAVRLDVTDQSTIEAAATWIEAEFGRLDVLVNNAGVTTQTPETFAPPSLTSVATVRENYETNVFGVIAVTNAMLPLLRRSPAARIVNVSSELGSLGTALDSSMPYFPINLLPYNSSKTALNGVTVAYAKELLDSPIKVNAVTPGYCATDLNGHSGPRSAAEGAVIAVRLATVGADGPTGGFFSDEGPTPW